jgi:tRNA(Ser,Leu) C12 N-acetylase TAN1
LGMDRLYQQAVDSAKKRANAEGDASGPKRGAEGGARDRPPKKPKQVRDSGMRTSAGPRGLNRHVRGESPSSVNRVQEKHGPGDHKNIPAHRGAFKKHLRKHTLLFQRAGGETARAILVTCDQGKEAKCIQSGCELIKMALASLSPAAPHTDSGAAAEGEARGDGEGGIGEEEERTEGEGAAQDAHEDGDGKIGRSEDMWVIDPGCNGLACITVEKKGIAPLRVLEAMWDYVDELGKDKEAIKTFYLKHKHCHRFIPLEVICRAVESEILSAVKTMIGQHFSASKPTTFSVVCDVRSCSSLQKMDLIKKVAELVDKAHTVQLHMPQTVILIQVVKAASGISILSGAPRYMRSQKSTFNLMIHAHELMSAGDQARGGGEPIGGAGEEEQKPSDDRGC